MSKLTFFIDESRDRFFIKPSTSIYNIIEKDIKGIDKRTGIPFSLLEKVQNKKNGWEKDATSFVQKKYLQNYSQLESKKEKLESWAKENWLKISETIFNISGKKVDDYNVHISHFFDLASWNGRTIAIPVLRQKENHGSCLWLIALSHLHNQANELGFKKEYDETMVHDALWVITYLIHKEVFNNKDNHKHAPKMHEKDAIFLENLFNEKKDMKDYLTKALEYIQENKVERIKEER